MNKNEVVFRFGLMFPHLLTSFLTLLGGCVAAQLPWKLESLYDNDCSLDTIIYFQAATTIQKGSICSSCKKQWMTRCLQCLYV